uniref:SEA domain-containing protein n=1 Tax=Magallana gigas TaxID=29159 RepID=A0A8W8IUT6_MAGGI
MQGIQKNVQGRKKGQDSTKKWITTATSEDFRREFIGRPRTMMTMVEDKPYNIASEQNGSTDDSLKNRTRYRTTVIIVLVSSCLVALAVALTIVFVIAKPQNEKLKSPNILVVTEGEITVLQNFTEDFHDKSSNAYRHFTAKFTTMMENGIRTEFLFRRKCYVTDLR